ncbi:hypothetical protein ILUMI_18797, partial [Ignelater luminosus]
MQRIHNGDKCLTVNSCQVKEKKKTIKAEVGQTCSFLQKTARAVAERAATNKKSKYKHIMEHNIFTPFLVETFGPWNEEAVEQHYWWYLQALQMVHSDILDVSKIYIEPPNHGQLTDEDSGEDDEGGLADNLSANQLRAYAEIEIIENNSEGVLEKAEEGMENKVKMVDKDKEQ